MKSIIALLSLVCLALVHSSAARWFIINAALLLRSWFRGLAASRHHMIFMDAEWHVIFSYFFAALLLYCYYIFIQRSGGETVTKKVFFDIVSLMWKEYFRLISSSLLRRMFFSDLPSLSRKSRCAKLWQPLYHQLRNISSRRSQEAREDASCSDCSGIPCPKLWRTSVPSALARKGWASPVSPSITRGLSSTASFPTSWWVVYITEFVPIHTTMLIKQLISWHCSSREETSLMEPERVAKGEWFASRKFVPIYDRANHTINPMTM